jgi:hypothetical protein
MVNIEQESEAEKALREKASKLVGLAQEILDPEKYKIIGRDSAFFPYSISIMKKKRDGIFNLVESGFAINVSENKIYVLSKDCFNNARDLAAIYEERFNREWTLKQLVQWD